MNESWLQVRELHKHYRRGPQWIRALDGVDLELDRGDLVALVGASGSGKSTLLNLLAGLDTPTSGSIRIDAVSLGELGSKELAAYRARTVGMVFQSFQLIPHRTALQNVEIALHFGEPPRREERRRRACAILEELGLGDRLDHRPSDLSGGEQQRVAVARALVKDPTILFADEPTGNLDRENADQIAHLLRRCRDGGVTVLLATHDYRFAARLTDRVYRLSYGRVVGLGDGGEERS